MYDRSLIAEDTHCFTPQERKVFLQLIGSGADGLFRLWRAVIILPGMKGVGSFWRSFENMMEGGGSVEGGGVAFFQLIPLLIHEVQSLCHRVEFDDFIVLIFDLGGFWDEAGGCLTMIDPDLEVVGHRSWKTLDLYIVGQFLDGLSVDRLRMDA